VWLTRSSWKGAFFGVSGSVDSEEASGSGEGVERGTRSRRWMGRASKNSWATKKVKASAGEEEQEGKEDQIDCSSVEVTGATYY
jgi:hypothetical protein